MLRTRFLTIITSLLSIVCFSCGSGEEKQTDQAVNQNKANTTDASGIKMQNILFFGTSLTAGYGLEQGEAYPELLQGRIDSLKLPYKTINGGLSGETSATGKNRIGWLLKQPVDIFVLELGANDGLRGIAVSVTTDNLQFIIDQVKKKYPAAKMVLAGMQIPPSMGVDYAADFREMFKTMAVKNNMILIPFLLDDVAGIAKLNQNDGIHPTAEGQKIIADNVWEHLKGLL